MVLKGGFTPKVKKAAGVFLPFLPLLLPACEVGTVKPSNHAGLWSCSYRSYPFSINWEKKELEWWRGKRNNRKTVGTGRNVGAPRRFFFKKTKSKTADDCVSIDLG